MVALTPFRNASIYLMRQFEDPLMIMFVCSSVYNNSCIKFSFMGLWSSDFFG